MTLVRRYLDLIKFEHTIFAMPFALISLLVATGGDPPLATMIWVLVAMVAARSAAMAFNRLADREYDAANDRTAARHLPAGEISVVGASLFVLVASALFVLAAGMLNSLCLNLSPVALVVILGYSLMKRFSAMAHLVLGLGLGIAPVGAWLASTGSFAEFPLWLAGAVTFWVAGFDTIYGCQDVAFDRGAGLFSLASRFGVSRALGISRAFHILAVLFMAGGFLRNPILGAASLVGVGVMSVLLIWEQILVRGGDLRRIDKAFFTINSYVGMALLAAVLVDLYAF